MSITNNVLSQSILRSSSSTDSSKQLYKIEYQGVIFDSPFYENLVNNIDYLKLESITIQMINRYMYRPDYVAYDYYGKGTTSTNFWYVILYVNGCLSITQFNIPNIIVPDYDVILEVFSSNKINRKNIIQIGGL